MIARLKADLRLFDLRCLWPSRNAYDDIRQFEKNFAQLAGTEHAVFFPYGRSAQIAILKTLSDHRNEKRDEVICPSYTCVVVAHAIVKAGLRPVFVDVGDDYNMRADLLNQATNERTLAVIATSVFGHPAQMSDYQKNHPSVSIIQDCAHSFFAQNEDGLGIHKQGLCAFYGLNVSKIITSVFGGMVTSDDTDFIEQLRITRQQLLHPISVMREVKQSLYLIAVLVAFHPVIYGLVNRLERWGVLNRFTKYYDATQIDLPSDVYASPTAIGARIGVLQCARYHDIIAHRRKLAHIYHHALRGVDGLILPPIHQGATVSHFVIQCAYATELTQYCLERGVQLGRLIDYEIPDMLPYQHYPYFGDRHSRTLPPLMINLPVHMGVSITDAAKVIDVVKSGMVRLSERQDPAQD